MKSSRHWFIRLYAFSFAIFLAAASSLAQETPPPAKDDKQDTPATVPAKPVFKDGQAQVVPEFKSAADWINEDLWVEAEFDSDGDGKKDRMHVSLTRQKQTESEGLKVPAIYMTSPYYAGTAGLEKETFWNPEQELGQPPKERKNPPEIPFQKRKKLISNGGVQQWVPRGFAVVHSCSPGTGLSQGCPTTGGDNESLAPKAVIDWLNGRAKGFKEPDSDEEVKATWCTGKVGMTGTSYNGTLPVAAATTGVEGLEAIIPVAPNTSYYHYYRSHGLIRHPGGYTGEDIDVLYNFIHSGDPAKREHCNSEVRAKELNAKQDRVTGDYNDFWAGRDYLNDMGPYKAATLMAHGFNDWNVMPEHSYRIYKALKEKGVPAQIYYHQGGHGGDPPFEMMNKWFTRYLYGIENGVEKEPKAYIVRESTAGAPRARAASKPTPYADYPNPEAKMITLHLSGGGKSLGGLSLEAKDQAVQETLIDDVSIKGADLAKAEISDHRLLYVTPELSEPVHISGVAKMKIKLACDRPAANLSVWLVPLPLSTADQAPQTDRIITRGWADPQNYRSITKGEPLEPGKYYDVAFELQPDDQIIPAGKRIGLMVFSSDRDFTLWPKAGTQLTVDLAGTALELPVVGGAEALKKAFESKPTAAAVETKPATN
jgi:X-Pro dipeptidyl-peptidase